MVKIVEAYRQLVGVEPEPFQPEVRGAAYRVSSPDRRTLIPAIRKFLTKYPEMVRDVNTYKVTDERMMPSVLTASFPLVLTRVNGEVRVFFPILRCSRNAIDEFIHYKHRSEGNYRVFTSSPDLMDQYIKMSQDPTKILHYKSGDPTHISPQNFLTLGAMNLLVNEEPSFPLEQVLR